MSKFARFYDFLLHPALQNSPPTVTLLREVIEEPRRIIKIF
jgi:hypothetical protein